MFSTSAISSSERSLSGGDIPDDDRHLTKTRARRRPPATFAGDDLKPIADRAHDDRLDDAVSRDRLREFREVRIVGRDARLELVRDQAIDVDFDRHRAARHGLVGNQRAQPLAETQDVFPSDALRSRRPATGPSGREPAAGRSTPTARSRHPAPGLVGAAVNHAFHAAVAADRSSISRASARYASAPRDFTS